ncbi:MAG: glycosyltransferase family 2 protein [Oscillospiraceae bacterium]|nr:glycosyltransferase family 2 protein [Oscillospiraceae bacterium]
MPSDKARILYMVVPCYNEEEVLGETARRLKAKYEQLIAENLLSEASRIVFVNDGSKDRTWQMITELHQSEPQYFSGINLAHNAGHQNAVLAGLMTVKDHCDMAITMDADLQDDINTIDEMVKKYYEGNQVVYGVRNARDTDTFFKRFTAESFYKLMQCMGADVVYNHADYRLMSRRVLEELANFREVHLFLRGMVPLIGFQSCNVYYARSERFAGESKYPLKKMLHFAMNGILSFSTKPLKLITAAGCVLTLMSIFALLWSLIVMLAGHGEMRCSGTLCSIWLAGGLQLIALGIIGEYIGKIYEEVKARPRYIIADVLNQSDEAASDSQK